MDQIDWMKNLLDLEPPADPKQLEALYQSW
jgi:hypothetical protein